MISLFRQKSPGNIAVLFLFGLLLKLPLFLHPMVLSSASDGPGYRQLAIFFKNSGGTFLAGILAFVLLYVQALMLNFSVNEYRMTTRQTFLPGMAYLLVTSLLPEWSYLSAPMVAGAFVLLAFMKLFSLYNAPSANTSIFNIGLLIGIASFFYFPALFFTLALFAGFMILRPFRLNEIFLYLLGLTTPYYFFVVYLFLTSKFQWQQLWPGWHIHSPLVQPTYWLLASIVLTTIPFLMGGYYIQTQLRKMLIQARKNWSVYLLFLLFGIFIPFINNDNSYTSWVLVAAPVAAFHSCAYLYPPRKWVASLLFFMMLLFILAQQYGGVFIKK